MNDNAPLVTTLVNGLRILETVVGADSESIGVTDIASRLRLHKSTVLRLLLTLESEGYVEQDPRTREFRPRMKLFELGSAVLARTELVKVARPLLEELGTLSGEVVHLAVLDQGEVVYIDKVESQHVIQMYSRVGRRSPAHCTGVGKALLAFLPDGEVNRILHDRGLRRFTDTTVTDPAQLKEHLKEIRATGFAVDDEEHEAGIRCLAAPIYNYRGQVVASISIAAPALRFTPERVDEMVGPILTIARRVSAGLGYRPAEAGARRA